MILYLKQFKIYPIELPQLKFEKLIAEGGQGNVWAGIFNNNDTVIEVAIKKIALQNFQIIACNEEEEKLKTLQNEYLVKYYGCCLDEQLKDNPYFCIVMEKLEGSVNYLIGNSMLTTQAHKFNAVTQIARGIEFLHNNSVAHRDLKLANILYYYDKVSQTYKYKLADLGFAKEFKKTGHTLIYTPPYIPPELEQLVQPYSSKATDIYCFGLIMYEIFKGEILSTNTKIIDLIDISPVLLRELICNCMSKEPKKRPSVQFVQIELAKIIGTSSPMITSQSPITQDNNETPSIITIKTN